jgi:hypothetical protein
MARTRGGSRREKGPAKRAESSGPARPATSEQDSTVRQWGPRYAPPLRATKPLRPTRVVVDAGGDVPWSQLPINALYTVFEALLLDKTGAEAVRKGAGGWPWRRGCSAAPGAPRRARSARARASARAHAPLPPPLTSAARPDSLRAAAATTEVPERRGVLPRLAAGEPGGGARRHGRVAP